MNKGWYILQVHSGFENKTVDAIKEHASKIGILDSFEDFLIPSETVLEVKRGKKIHKESRFFPGYIIMKVELNDSVWEVIRGIPRVASFLGNKGNPRKISESELNKILKHLKENAGIRKHKVTFEIGEQIKVQDGPFTGFCGIVEKLDSEKERMTVLVTVFGRETPVDLEFSQVSKC